MGVFFHEELCHYFPPLKYMEKKRSSETKVEDLHLKKILSIPKK